MITLLNILNIILNICVYVIYIIKFVYICKNVHMCVCVWVWGITPLNIAGRYFYSVFLKEKVQELK